MPSFPASAANLGPIRQTGRDARANDDAALLSRIASGDKAAMQALFSNHHVPVYRFILRRLRNKALAEEVTGAVFLDVWRHAARFEGRSLVSTWILAIARQKTFAARPRFRQSQFDGGAAESRHDVADGPDAILPMRNRNNLLRNCLAKLSAEHRELIDLVYCQKQSIDAVATILGISRDTARTRLFDARRQLFNAMKKSAGNAP